MLKVFTVIYFSLRQKILKKSSKFIAIDTSDIGNH